MLWLLQTVFFGKIYAAVKKNDITDCADVVAAESVNGSAGSAALAAAKKYACCVSVYEISGNTGYKTATAHVRSSCMIHSIEDNSLLNELYNSAKKDGSAFKQIVLDFDGSERIATPDLDGASGPSSVIYAEVATAGEVDYLVLVDSEISPISATTRVLTYQLMVISAIVLVSAVVISAVMSRRLSKPIERMTKEASLLATGNYDVNFDGGSFREARELGDTLNFAASELSKLDTMQKELMELQAAKVTNADMYSAAQDRWMESTYNAFNKFLTPEQWEKYLKNGAAREKKARDKRAQKAAKASEKLRK